MLSELGQLFAWSAIGVVCVESFRKKRDHGSCETPKIDHEKTLSTEEYSLTEKGTVEGIVGKC